ncbi:HEAT repeat domain-containing protein [Halorientalis salina]|uniref:HEAT repeat domain-containing protein n=1 Tax=Halorientalis salina TaxID=2932266 RepID=UPI0010AD683C|nr:HEAT repeat domain-containing protein [Halorientalis salina]
MFIGDDEPDWRPVVEDLSTRLDAVIERVDDVETEEEIVEIEEELDDVENTLETSDVPADSDEYETLEEWIEEARNRLPPAWLPQAGTFEDRLDEVESEIETVETADEIDAVEADLAAVESDLEDSDVPEDADEYATLESRISDLEGEVPEEYHPTVWDYEAELDEIEAELDEATLESELDDIEAELDDVESDIEASEVPEDAEAHEELLGRIEDLRGEVEGRRGPYAEDVAEEIETAEGTLTDGDWTPTGTDDVAIAVEEFLDVAGSEFVETFEADSDSPADLAAALEDVRGIVEETDLDADEDDDTIETLLAAAETLTEELDAAEEWTDLSVRDQLDRKGFYEPLESENRKDFPAEWNAIKLHEKAYRAGDSEAIEMILLGLETFDSDFMEENVLDSLRRIAPPEAYEDLEPLANKRNQDAIEILGKIGDERILETITEFVEGGDVALRKTTLRAIGAIGSEESTQTVADQLVDDNPEVRSTAARALGLIGDTRAIEPLADVLEGDDRDEVRASAAWALNTIGTERAREVVTEYTDDAAYIVQVEAEKAATEPAA